MELHLNDGECAALLHVLDSYLIELRTEIVRTDRLELRQELRSEGDQLRRIRTQLVAWTTGSPAPTSHLATTGTDNWEGWPAYSGPDED
jgi:hypothetical protein